MIEQPVGERKHPLRRDTAYKVFRPFVHHLDQRFDFRGNALISGLIWSRRSIGNFLGQPDDFVFVQNQVGSRPVRRTWLKWSEAYVVIDDGRRLWATKRRTGRKTFKVSSGFR
jgi:hypothetical protein